MKTEANELDEEPRKEQATEEIKQMKIKKEKEVPELMIDLNNKDDRLNKKEEKEENLIFESCQDLDLKKKCGLCYSKVSGHRFEQRPKMV